MRIWLAIRVFFQTLFQSQVADAVRRVLAGEGPADQPRPAPSEPAPPQRPAQGPKPVRPPVRSDALTLLATLQREARFVDIVREPLADYSDAQIGAAARDVLRDCGVVLDRLFGLRAVVDQEEGSPVEAPAGFDAARYRITGNVSGAPPFRGRLVHHGWEATRCDLPQWSGSESSAMILAPIELEV